MADRERLTPINFADVLFEDLQNTFEGDYVSVRQTEVVEKGNDDKDPVPAIIVANVDDGTPFFIIDNQEFTKFVDKYKGDYEKYFDDLLSDIEFYLGYDFENLEEKENPKYEEIDEEY